MNKNLILQSVLPRNGAQLKELNELRDLIQELGINRFTAHVGRYDSKGVFVYTLALASTNGDLYHMRIRHFPTVRLFKTEEAVSRTIKALGIDTKTTYFHDFPISRK